MDETEEILKTKQSELSDVSNKLEIIRKNIPLEARRVIINDRLYNTQQSLKILYEEANSLQTELKKIDNNGTEQIPEEFLSKIKNLIEPKFIIKERIENLKTILTILTTLASVSFALIPLFGKILGAVFFVMAIPVLAKLGKEYILFKMPNNELVKVNLRIQVEILLLLLVIGFLILTLYLSLIASFSSFTSFAWKIIYSTNLIAPVLIIFVVADIVRQSRKKKKMQTSYEKNKTNASL